ncbi:hypothetical protein [Chamaesiphon polymorphus]|uniref:Uncharacterized protein n=1 Tax=Chamaesiphon polymorphus CCALA 037 TaxID=2107692 RepID=A0A2T1GGT8_9CYAN|nr:hypothetical protein [Chamaesiphon polymorphus]PSB56890.1 hypothetical protein C7B77_10265 [Chamaesiphon polymorphus CCALA 037]
MLKPIQLPSGKIIDIDKCLAIIPGSTSTDSEVVLSGIEHHLQIDSIDLETLNAAIQQQIVSQPRYAFEFRTISQDLERRDRVSDRFEALRQKRSELSTQPDADRAFEVFSKLVDAERASGQKLYSLE